MVAASSTPSVSELVTRIIQPERGDLSAERARFVLNCRFPAEDQRRLKELAQKQRDGSLTAEDELEMDRYIQVADFLEALKAKALASLSC